MLKQADKGAEVSGYVVLYLVATLAACIATLREHFGKDDLASRVPALGIAACIVWPLTVLVMVLHMGLLRIRARRIARQA